MVEIRDIELRSYSTAAAGSLVFNRVWQLRKNNEPVQTTIAETYFVVIDPKNPDRPVEKLRLSLGNGLTYDDADKSVHIQITNEHVNFIRSDTTMEYAFYVVWDHGEAQTIREGAVNALRVA
jgi:hypothetical protein